MVRRINIFLWLVVFFYLIYAMVMEGPTAKMIGQLVLAIPAVIAQIIGSPVFLQDIALFFKLHNKMYQKS